MLGHVRMSSQSRSWVCGLLLLALGLTTSCGSGTKQKSTSPTTPPVSSSVSAPPPTSSPPPPASHTAPTGGDPAIYAAAISEIQSYLTMEVEHGPAVAAATFLAPDMQIPVGTNTTWPPLPDADPQMPVLVAGSVYSYVPWSWTSADQFTLYVTLDLHFRGDPARANWYEGHNTEFFTFSRPTPQTPWRMETGSAPYPEADPNSG